MHKSLRQREKKPPKKLYFCYSAVGPAANCSVWPPHLCSYSLCKDCTDVFLPRNPFDLCFNWLRVKLLIIVFRLNVQVETCGGVCVCYTLIKMFFLRSHDHPHALCVHGHMHTIGFCMHIPCNYLMHFFISFVCLCYTKLDFLWFLFLPIKANTVHSKQI